MWIAAPALVLLARFTLPLADCDDVAFGRDGDLYFACHSPEDRFEIPVRGAKDKPDEMDAYVLRYRPSTGKLIYATRYGGSSYDSAMRIAVDRRGFAYATGLTRSADFPIIPGATRRRYGGNGDAYLVKLAPDGEIVESTFIGGAQFDIGNAIAVGRNDVVYIGGTAAGNGFVCAGPARCEHFGGSAEEKLTQIVIDEKRNRLWAAGYTHSKDFPVKAGQQRELRGTMDAFLTAFSLPSLTMTSSTYYGGSGQDSAWSLTLTPDGDSVLAGTTDSNDLVGASAGWRPANTGKQDAFLTRFRDGRIVAATYFGGSGNDESGYDGASVKVDRRGRIWLAGVTHSADLPLKEPHQTRFAGGEGDGFVAAFSPKLDRLCFASYEGVSERDLLEGLSVSPKGVVAVAGVVISATPQPNLIRIGSSPYHATARVLLFDPPAGCR